jgi:hypothetical protein
VLKTEQKRNFKKNGGIEPERDKNTKQLLYTPRILKNSHYNSVREGLSAKYIGDHLYRQERITQQKKE